MNIVPREGDVVIGDPDVKAGVALEAIALALAVSEVASF